jgi:hypothetical protein|tara:strand:- start:657 stop:2957 length:2301 start_codon:yes stop_codon:yes gene_type:complete
MEEIELPGKDGKMYFVDLSLVPENMTPQQFLDSRFTEDANTSPESRIPETYERYKVGEEAYGPNAGYIYRNPNLNENPEQSLGYVDPVYSTSDQEEIRMFGQGGTPGAAYQRREAEDIVNMNPAGVRINTAVRGLPFAGEYVDEAAGYLVSPERREQIRASQSSMETARPKEALALEMGTGIITSAPGLGTLRTASKSVLPRILERAAQGSVIGSAEGAVSGYGRGTDEESRREGAVEGAKWGAGFGLAGGGFGGFLETGLQRRFNGVDIRNLASELGISEQAAKDLKNLALGDITDTEIRRRMVRSGADARVIDASPNASVLLDVTRSKLGPAMQTSASGIEDMSRIRGREFRQSVNEIFEPFPESESVEDIVNTIMQRSAPERESAYKQVYRHIIDYGSRTGRNIQKSIDRINKGSPRLLRQAIEEANLEIAGSDELINPIAYRVFTNQAGEEVFELLPNQTSLHLDFLKRGLQTTASKQTDDFGRLNATGNNLNNLANRLKKSLIEEVPGYRAALRLGMDAIQEKEAIRLVKNFNSEKVGWQDFRNFIDQADSPEHRQMLLENLRKMLGFEMKAVMDRTKATLGNPNATEDSIRAAMGVLRRFGSPEAKKKMRLIIGTQRTGEYVEATDKLIQQIGIEGNMALNSKTTFRSAAIEQLDTPPGFIESVKRGKPLDAVAAGVRNIFGPLDDNELEPSIAILDELARVLVTETGDDARRIVESIMRVKNNQEITSEMSQKIAQRISAYTSAAAYQTGETIGLRREQ